MATVLVVDDDRLICDLLKAALGQQGYQVLVATGGREAIELFRRHAPRVTLLDLHMPDMDGLTVLRRMRVVDPDAAVMIVTGGGLGTCDGQARSLGATGYFQKGQPIHVLVEAVNRVARQPVALAGLPGASDEELDGEADRSVLVVDDEEMIRLLLGRYLMMRGYRVRLARDGREALALMAEECPSAVILDMYMPGMNGVEVCRAMRERRYRSSVVFLTASQDEALLQEALRLGSVDVLAKPVDLEKLALVLEIGEILSEPDDRQLGREAPAR
ncbi:MAG: response regulator [Nitrospirota bacterium]